MTVSSEDSLKPNLQPDRKVVRTMLERVRQHRLRRNWSQEEMAARTGLSRLAYLNFENGYGNITLANLVRVLGVLGLTNNLMLLIPPVTEEPTLEKLLEPAKLRSSRKRKVSS
ncbi:MAG: hypothetical protein QG602_2759 [Verrucomicrobiota bacterium]|nr:hypothetical protein [Verrucomicrobiota bacterium]